MFLDTSIPMSLPHGQLKKMLAHLAYIGYDGAVLNSFFTPTPRDFKIKPCEYKPIDFEGKSPSSDLFTSPANVLRFQDVGKSEFLQHTRITIVVGESQLVHKMNLKSPTLKTYDIVAVQPTSEKIFKMACESLEVDVISIDFSKKLGFHMKAPAVGNAISRGIQFEIVVSPALRNPACKKFVILNALNLIKSAKGKNIILSSGALSLLDLRGPYDLANLGTLFGLSHAQGIAALSAGPRSALLHGQIRHTHRAVTAVSKVSELGESEQWKGLEINHMLKEQTLKEDAYKKGKEEKIELKRRAPEMEDHSSKRQKFDEHRSKNASQESFSTSSPRKHSTSRSDGHRDRRTDTHRSEYRSHHRNSYHSRH